LRKVEFGHGVTSCELRVLSFASNQRFQVMIEGLC
jgi:hypothetical protein